MKKKLTLLFASIAILFTACTKDGENPIITDSTWYFNGTAHFTAKSARTEASGSTAAKIVFTDTNKDRDASLTVYFKALPKTEGSYTLVQGAGLALGTNEVAVSASDKTLTDLVYTATTPITVQVTITTAGKVQIAIPEVALGSLSGSGSETYKLSANVFEVN